MILNRKHIHEVTNVALGFRKLHDIHALSRVPMQEGLSLEHGRKLEKKKIKI
jgi:hypothetical protein